ncbi:MAG: translation initiation factor [Mariniblastus sp.]
MRLFEGTELDRPPRCETCNELESACKCPPAPPKKKPAGKQTARIRVEKRKGGKLITVVAGLSSGNPGDHLGEILTSLKNACGAGGTIQAIEPTKNYPNEMRQIELQGDHTDRVEKLLGELGFKTKT